MKLTLTEEMFEFEFPAAKALYKFDEREKLSPTYHGAPMQAVDVMAEFDRFQVWIEIKEFTGEEIAAMKEEGDQRKKGDDYHNKAYLTKNLKHKFRDTFLYRYCEEKIRKPILYICLTNFDDALNGFFRKELQKQLPAGRPNVRRWTRELIAKERIFVVNLQSWERNFTDKLGTCLKLE